MNNISQRSKFTLDRKVTFWILFISGIFAVLATIVQLYVDYKIEIKGIENTLSIIEQSHIKSLENSVWFMDTVNIKTKTEEMLKLPHIVHLNLQLKGMDDIILGDLPAPKLRIQNQYALYPEKASTAEKIQIGNLVVTASLEEVYSTIKDKIIIILISQAIKTFFVSFFILFLIHSLITRHLKKISRYLTDISTKTDKLKLERSRLDLHLRKQDELDQLVDTINKMQADLQNSLTALKKSERNYREIFNATSDAIFIQDGKTGRIIDVNKAMLTMYGYKKKEALGLTPVEFSPGTAPYDPKGVKEKINAARKNKSHIFEWKARKKDGTVFWTEVNLKFSKIGNEEKLIAVARDISERKKTQEMMVQSEKMLSVGGLAAGMAHEINNPLAGVMQTADVMEQRLTDLKIPANQRAAQKLGITMNDISAFMEKRDIPRMILTIKESGRRIAAIVQNMLSFARKNSTKSFSHSLEGLLDKAFELAATDFDLEKNYDFKMIKIKKEYEDNVPCIPCEGARIQQVLLNILLNGAQAMQEAGTKEPMFIVKTYFEKTRKMVCMEIADNGPGMNKETLKRIFEPFFTTKPTGKGTGLGLSVSYFIITENHGGEISVKSAPDSGARFIIRLPLEGKDGNSLPLAGCSRTLQ